MAAKSDALFAELAAQAKEGDHEKALVTAEKSAHLGFYRDVIDATVVLQALPNDVDALASKLVCLIHLGTARSQPSRALIRHRSLRGCA